MTGVTLTDGTILNLDGVFVLRNAVAPGTLLRGLELDGANIAVDRQMRTNKPGCFAAGDCTGRPYQLAKAVGEGNIAAHSLWPTLRKRISNKTKQAVTLLGVAACFLRTERCSLQRIIKEKR